MSTTDESNNDTSHTDENQPTPDGLSPISLSIDWYERPDPTLQDLVSIANLGVGAPLTLYLPWGVVSGHAHPPHEFFAAAAASNRSGAQDSADENASELADAVAKRAFDPWARPIPEQERLNSNLQQGYDLTTFISLTHVKAWLSGSATPIEHEHLRVRLSAVSAWAHGMIR
ncbi:MULTISPECIES: hypothetical protein [Mycobacterium]|uniref:hypothetical protein n=1 Tax=Mycobacterium TaxID=1763 RepID=UPI0012E38474|nr:MULTISPECIES: hypothetical protein [Mycobacterium]MDP7728489.1 hypothetical protein [Mycobacterium sp. TY813]